VPDSSDAIFQRFEDSVTWVIFGRMAHSSIVNQTAREMIDDDIKTIIGEPF